MPGDDRLPPRVSGVDVVDGGALGDAEDADQVDRVGGVAGLVEDAGPRRPVGGPTATRTPSVGIGLRAATLALTSQSGRLRGLVRMSWPVHVLLARPVSGAWGLAYVWSRIGAFGFFEVHELTR